MKRIVLFFIIAMCSADVFSQSVTLFSDTISNYHVNTSLRQKDVSFMCTNVKDQSYIIVSLSYPEQYQIFHNMFKEIFDKFEEWVKVADENNVKDMHKEMPIQNYKFHALARDGVKSASGTAKVTATFSRSEKFSSTEVYVYFFVGDDFNSFKTAGFMMTVSAEDIPYYMKSISPDLIASKRDELEKEIEKDNLFK